MGTENPNSRGAALSIVYSSGYPDDPPIFGLEISHCYFGSNSSNNLFIYARSGNSINHFGKVLFKDNIVEHNSEQFGFYWFDSVDVVNCKFENNGIKKSNFLLSSAANRTVIKNTLFSNNKGILNIQRNPNALDTIINCTFYNNLADTTSTQLFGNALFSNCIFDQEIEGNAFPFYAANVTLENSLILSSDCNTLPSFVTCGPGNIFGLEPLFADTTAGDFHLLPSSPGINAGNNTIVDELNIATDLGGNSRIKFCTVDMGAYEAPDYEVVVLATTSQSTCSGQPGGAVQFQLMNGCAPYAYAWSNGASSGTGTTDLFPGTYVFTITDALGKTVAPVVTIPGVPAVEATTTALPYNCSTGSNGSVTVTTTSGTAPFEYLWNDSTTNASLVNLLAGDYSVTITDANGCTLVDSVTMGTVGNLSLGINISPITCHGDSNGTATVQPIGGTAPFAWLWASGDDTPMVDSLAGGSYVVTVTDALGCTGVLDFTMTPPTEVMVSLQAMQPTCFWNFGSATASATGGTGSFGYSWNNGAMTATNMLPAGVYSVTATDVHGCTGTASVIITAPPALQADVVAQPPVLCFGASNGTLAVLPSGGTPPYGWSGPTENLAAGSYVVTITDSNACTAVAEANIGEHPEIAATETITNASGFTASDGSIELEAVTGGTGSGYQFLWSNGAMSQNLTDVPTGDYSLTVTDSQGCTANFMFFVDFGSAAGEASANPFGAAIVPNPSGSGGARLVLDSTVSSLSIRIFDAQGKLVASSELTTSEYTLPKGLAAGTYWVVLGEGEKRLALEWVVMGRF